MGGDWSGTSSLMRRYSPLCSRKRHGSLSRMQALIRPFASDGVDGATTLMPGACANHISMFREWKGPALTPPPQGPRNVTGTPCPQRYRLVHAKLTIGSNAQAMKSMNWN